MRVAQSNVGEIAFISYISHEDRRRSKQRELLQSDARKHAAVVSHRKRRASAQTHNASGTENSGSVSSAVVEAGCQQSDELPLQQRLDIERTSSPDTTSDTVESLSVWGQESNSESAQWQHQSPQHVSLTSSRGRPLDWHFGSVGLSCRPLSDIDHAAFEVSLPLGIVSDLPNHACLYRQSMSRHYQISGHPDTDHVY